MRKAVAAALLALPLALPACRAEAPEQPERAARRPPEPACDSARAALTRRSRDGSFLFEEQGAAMVDRQAWLQMDEGSRDQLIERLAVLAGCTAATPQREVEVVVRSETGDVLTRRQVVPSTDFRTGAQ